MDHNLVVLAGRLAAAPELREFEGGSRFVRYLVSVRAVGPPRRVDVLPVILWDPPQDLLDTDAPPGQRVFAAGMVQRRFWESSEGRRSRIEVVASQICLREEPDAEPFAGPDDDTAHEG